MASNDQMDCVKNYEVFDAVGHGGFGKVHRARCLKSNLEVAIKFIEKRRIKDQPMIKRVKSEVEIHSRLKHPHVLEVLNFFEDDVYVYLVLEFCENGDLNSYLKRHSKLSEQEACHFMQQIVNGILYLHKHNIMHRDLKLSNILLTKDMTVKVADFGVATRLENSEEKHFTMCGTPNFIAPEVVLKGPYGLEADIWSIGCMLYSLLVGEPPFSAPDVKNTLNRIISTGYDLPDELSSEAKDLIGLLLQKDGKDRIALEKILEHSFFVKRSSNSSFCVAANETSSADSGRDTLGTTSGELMSGSNPFSSAASSLDSGSNVHPIASVTNQPIHDGDVSRVQPPAPAFSGAARMSTESCQKQQPQMPANQNTPVRQLFSATKKLQREEAQQNAPSSDRGYFGSSVLGPNNQQYYGSSNSTDRENLAATCQNPTIFSGARPHVQSLPNKSGLISDYHGARRAACPSPNVAVSGPLQSASKLKLFPNEIFLPNDLEFRPMLYESHHTTESPFDMDIHPQDFHEPNRRSPALSEGSASEEQYDDNIRKNEPGFGGRMDSGNNIWMQPIEEQDRFRRTVHHHQSDNDLYHSDGVYGSNRQTSNKRLGIHSPVTVRGAMTLQRSRSPHQVPIASIRSRSVDNISQLDDGQSGRWSAVSIDVDGEQLPQKVFRAPPLFAVRLRPFTEKKKGAVAHILEDGDVYLEFFKSCGNEERVFEALRISQDGQMIKTYHMNFPLDSSLRPRLHSVPSQTFTYAMLPKKYWKKYEYASRFVNALRSVTVKLTLYSERAKAVLMENSPNQDFEVNFYDGGRFKVRSSGTTITQSDGTSMILDASSSFTHLSHETQDMWQHVQELHVLCKEFDAFFTKKLSHRLPCFPIVIGRKPSSPLATKHSEQGKMNEMDAISSRQNQPMTGFGLTNRDALVSNVANVASWSQHPKLPSRNSHEIPSRMSASERHQESLVHNQNVQLRQMKMYKFSPSKLKPASFSTSHSSAHVVKQIQEPSIGAAYEYSNGLILIAFNNGSKAQLDRTTSQVILKDRSGQCTVFAQNDTLPGKIVTDLYTMLGKLGLYSVE